MSYEVGPCRPEELFQLVDLANRVFRANRGGDMGEEYPLVFEVQNAGNLMVARREGQLVSHVGVCLRDAALLGASVRVASIGAVSTDPDHRGHGLASRLMDLAREHSIRQGASLMLISGGRGLYHRLGYVQVGAFQSYTVPAGEADPEFQVRPFEEGDTLAVARLHQREPIRFLRPVEDWRKLVAAGMLMNRPADLLMILHQGEVVAYAGVQRPVAATASPTAAASVRETAGSRVALARALPGIAGRYGASQAEIIVDPNDGGWRVQAAVNGWTGRIVSFPGTLGIIDPACFLETIRPLVEERAGADLRIEAAGRGAHLSHGSETLDLESMGQLTALVFGGETEEARAVPPVPPGMRAAVTAAFPLPLLWYGYNYV